MIEARDLRIMPIADLDIYYRCHTRDTTSLSIHIDGVTIYTLDVRGLIKPNSRTGTIGAFRSTDKRSLVAWIDPVSGNVITSDPTVYDSALAIPVLAIMAVFATMMFHLALFVAVPLAGVGVIWATRRIVRGRRNNAELESMLRDGTCYQPKSAPNASRNT
ncbi:hypothetical protein FSO04_30845 [Paraburkholderia madseniana]|uniref:Uncharacterized protein n=1 Tax=Paraburkholderia madseniana TaxID=2599607 RepID=A0A6N6W8M1_9BURK|nr:hypothetical protein [Paraburkholderia madseniana]KAE8756104.1 hypothetical protein FSO04_30845 [Paraburkholderia madseniana]